MQVKLKAGKFRLPATLTYQDGRIFVQFRYFKPLIAEIKAMSGARWHGREKPPRKVWSIADNQRNAFQLDYLQGKNPYSCYDREIKKHDYIRPLYEHQKDAADFMSARHYCILAGEMGVGKTLAAIEVMERSGCSDIWYVAPRAGILAVEREFKKWGFDTKIDMMTYDGLTKRMKNWEPGALAPVFVVFDESQKLMNPTTQRSQAAMMLANGIRDDYGDEGFVILMSGTPAPKKPSNWWHQCEVARPGFLKEGDYHKFEKSVAIVVQREAFAGGGVYPHLQTWLDDENKCAICGEFEDDDAHDREMCEIEDTEWHPFERSRNEVLRLYKRMNGLVLVQLKKDCLDLPDKIYRRVILEPSQETVQIAKSLIQTSSTVIGGLTLVRELSDGFQYQKVKDGVQTCKVCNGSGQMINPIELEEKCECDGCGGIGKIPKYKRIAHEIGTPKDDALLDLLDENSDVGRIIIYAAFTGSIDRVVRVCQDHKWDTIRVDGRGWDCSMDCDDPLSLFQDQLEEHPKVAFIAHPASGGICLTLTAAAMAVYYSNPFNGDDRMQSEDRPHRPGMDLNLGVTIVDLLHLPTDLLVLVNLQKKRRLQSLTLGEVLKVFEESYHD